MSIINTEPQHSKKDSDKERGEVVNFSDPKLPAGTPKKLDLDNPDDAWARTAPPPKGYYDLKLFFAKDGTRKRYEDPDHQKPEEVFYVANLECRIVNADEPDYNDTIIFANVSTRLGRGKGISTMAALMVKMGKNPIPKGMTEATDRDVATKFEKWIKEEPIIKGNLVDWKASYKDSSGKWRNPFRTYEDFPETADGGREYQFSFTNNEGGKEEANAQLFVAEWGGKESKVTEKPTTKVKVSMVSNDDDEGEEEKPKPVKGKPKVVVTDDEVDDL